MTKWRLCKELHNRFANTRPCTMCFPSSPCFLPWCTKRFLHSTLHLTVHLTVDHRPCKESVHRFSYEMAWLLQLPWGLAKALVMLIILHRFCTRSSAKRAKCIVYLCSLLSQVERLWTGPGPIFNWRKFNIHALPRVQYQCADMVYSGSATRHSSWYAALPLDHPPGHDETPAKIIKISSQSLRGIST